MPPVDAEYLIGILWEVGPVLSSGGYPCAITHEELLAWQSNIGVTLQPWEIRFLHRLSAVYLSASHAAEKADCPAPVRQHGSADLSAVAKSMQQYLKELSSL